MNRKSTRTSPRKKTAAATESGELLASDAALQAWCAGAPPAQPVALDTEFVGERTYYPRLELLQIKVGERIALVDVPACRDWSHLATWLADADRLKILHAAESDLPLLYRLTGIWAAPVFDTQLAAAFLGHGAQISLTNLIKSQVRVDVGSHQTTSDWSQRPLSAAQLDYAADDVRYLPRLQAQLEEALRQANRWAWYEEEQRARLAQMMTQEEDPLDVMYKRVRGWQALKPRDLAILRELAAWREGVSRAKDLPRRRLVSDEGLIELARHQPASRQDALNLRRVYPNQITRYYDDVRAALERGRGCPEDEWPARPIATPRSAPVGLLEIAQAFLRALAESHEIAPTLLATTSELEALVADRKRADPARHALLQGWRHAVAGAHLLELLDGRLAVRVGPSGTLVFESAQP